MATLTCPVIDLTDISITTDTEGKEPERTCPICMEKPDYESCAFCPGCIVPICTEPCLENHLYSEYGDKCPVCNYEWDLEIMGLKANIFDDEHVVKGVHPLDLKEEEQRNFDILVKEHQEEQKLKIKILDVKIYATVKQLVAMQEEKKLLISKLL